jgi:arylsulfatase A-like enzyme
MAPQKPPEELYDLKADPHELHNLAHSTAHEMVLKDLREALRKWMDECDDRPDKHGAMRK